MKKLFRHFFLPQWLLLFTAFQSQSQFLDPSFATGGKAGPFNNGFYPASLGQKIQSAQSMTIDNNGRILIAGHKSNGVNEDFAIMRLNADGTPDNSYGTNGVQKFADLTDKGNSDEYATAIAFNNVDNTCIIAGYRITTDINGLSSDIVVMQLNADGSVNNSFAQQGVRIIDEARNEEVYAIAFGDGGQSSAIFLGGFTNPDFIDFTQARGRIYRMSRTGGSLTNFVIDFAGASCHIFSLAVDASGNLLAGGDNDGGGSRFAIARFQPNGSFDNSFDGDGKAFINVGNTPAGVSQIKIQADGKILAAGGFFDVNTGTNGTVVARVNNDGTVDNSFSGGFKFVPFNYTGNVFVPRSIALQSDGKILVTGPVDGVSSNPDFAVGRLNTDGSLDNSFGTNGIYSLDFNDGSIDFNNALLVQSDGKLVTGAMTRPSTNDLYTVGLIRLQFTEPVPCSITGPSQACDRTTVVFQGPSNLPPNSLSWSITGNASITQVIGNTVQVLVGGGGSNTFTLSLTTTVNSQSTNCSKTVTVTPPQSCSIIGPSQSCAGKVDAFTAPIGGSNYQWTITNGGGNIIGQNNLQSVSIQASSGYTLNLFYTDGGCSHSCSINVSVNPPPPCNINGPASVYSGTTNNVYSAPPGMTGYNWTVSGNGSIVGNANGQTVTISAGGTGSFTLQLTTTLNGCSSQCPLPVAVTNTLSACTYTQDFFSKKSNKGCVNGVLTPVTQMMLNAFGPNDNSKVFGSIANSRYFTLFRLDVNGGNIFKMLPGFDGAQVIAVDNIAPITGAYYDDKTTWPLVPIPANGMQKGQISNSLLSQLMTLWFNLANNTSLRSVPLTQNVLSTKAQTSCGNNTPTGNALNFTLPQTVIAYLNSQDVYTKDVNGLFQLANDVLGGANTTVSPADARDALDAINSAFNGCRVLTGTSSTQALPITKNLKEEMSLPTLSVVPFPNPFHGQFSLNIHTPVSGTALIEFFSINGTKIYEMKKGVKTGNNLILYKGPSCSGSLLYSVSLNGYTKRGVVVNLD